MLRSRIKADVSKVSERKRSSLPAVFVGPWSVNFVPTQFIKDGDTLHLEAEFSKPNEEPVVISRTAKSGESFNFQPFGSVVINEAVFGLPDMMITLTTEGNRGLLIRAEFFQQEPANPGAPHEFEWKQHDFRTDATDEQITLLNWFVTALVKNVIDTEDVLTTLVEENSEFIENTFSTRLKLSSTVPGAELETDTSATQKTDTSGRISHLQGSLASAAIKDKVRQHEQKKLRSLTARQLEDMEKTDTSSSLKSNDLDSYQIAIERGDDLVTDTLDSFLEESEPEDVYTLSDTETMAIMQNTGLDLSGLQFEKKRDGSFDVIPLNTIITWSQLQGIQGYPYDPRETVTSDRGTAYNYDVNWMGKHFNCGLAQVRQRMLALINAF